MTFRPFRFALAATLVAMLGIAASPGSWLASDAGVQVDTKWGGGKTFFSGEGLFLLRCTGDGDMIVSSYGAIERRTLGPGEVLKIDTGHIVAFQEGIGYQVNKVGGWKSTLLSGEGLVATFTGPGTLWLQTRSPADFIGWRGVFVGMGAFAALAVVAAVVGFRGVPPSSVARVDIKAVSLLANVLAKQAAREQGAREAWFVDTRGFITEGSSSNAWIVTAGGEVVTRPADHGILNGISRAVVVDAVAAQGLVLVEREKPLVEVRFHRKNRLVAKKKPRGGA